MASKALTNHEEIRKWAEERKAQPSCVLGTGGGEDVGMIRLDFPIDGKDEKLEPISWDDWFQKFDERNLALLVEEANGKNRNFNKLVSRGTADERGETHSKSSASRSSSSGTSRKSGSSSKGSSSSKSKSK